jgi:hypothetical protein
MAIHPTSTILERSSDNVDATLTPDFGNGLEFRTSPTSSIAAPSASNWTVCYDRKATHELLWVAHTWIWAARASRGKGVCGMMNPSTRPAVIILRPCLITDRGSVSGLPKTMIGNCENEYGEKCVTLHCLWDCAVACMCMSWGMRYIAQLHSSSFLSCGALGRSEASAIGPLLVNRWS